MGIPNFPKPIPRLFFRYQIFRNRYRDFFSETKFSETETETFFPIPSFPKPIPRLFFRKKVSVSVSENLVSEKKSQFRFRKIWFRKKSLGIGFGKFGIGKK